MRFLAGRDGRSVHQHDELKAARKLSAIVAVASKRLEELHEINPTVAERTKRHFIKPPVFSIRKEARELLRCDVDRPAWRERRIFLTGKPGRSFLQVLIGDVKLVLRERRRIFLSRRSGWHDPAADRRAGDLAGDSSGREIQRDPLLPG